MASIKTRTLTTGRKAYLVRWTPPGANEASKQFDKMGDARRFKAEIEAELSRGTYVDPKAGDVAFRVYAAQWQANQMHRRSTRQRVDKVLRLHVNPVIGDRPLRTLRRSDLQALVGQLKSKKLAPTYIAAIFQVVTSVLRSAVFDKLIPESPAVQIALPRRPADDMVIPTVKQVRAIAGEVPERMRALILVAATTGLRQSELSGLELGEIDFLGRDRELRVRRQLISPHKGGPAYMSAPKSEASVREVPLADEAARALAAHLAKYPARELVLPTEDDIERQTTPDGWRTYSLVFTNKHGAALRANNINPVLRPILARHGFPSGTGLHVFRHFYASALIVDGLSVKDVQERLGHASASETLNTYLHLWPDTRDRSRSAIDKAFAAAEQDATEDATEDAAEAP